MGKMKPKTQKEDEIGMKMLNNRVFGSTFGKGNNNDVGVHWDTVLEILEQTKQEEREKIFELMDKWIEEEGTRPHFLKNRGIFIKLFASYCHFKNQIKEEK
jgi:rhamnogalacturonyl hydrolase YesR